MGLRGPDQRLQKRSRRGAAPPVPDLDGVLRHHGLHRVLFVAIPKGLLSGPGHRSDPGHRLCRARRLAGPDARHPATAFRRPGARSRHRRFRLVLRQRRRQYAQHRALLPGAEAARRAQSHRDGDHQPAAAATRQDRGRAAVPAAVAGHHRRRPHFRRPIPVHHAGPGVRGAEHLGAENAGQAARRCPNSPTSRPISRPMRRCSR